jgi:hypothetical protein
LGPAYLAAEYNCCLARANSARKDGRHYALRYHHNRVPDICWTIDPNVTHNVDVMVDVADNSLFRNRQLDVMIRNAMVFNSEDDRESDWYHKNWGGDVGMMHTIGTNVDFDKVGTSPYAANGYILERLLRLLVVSLSQIGRHLFPQVYLVVRDVESDSGLLPVPPMNGAGRCCGRYTVDISMNLGNSLHIDASQGSSVRTEEFHGRRANWYFVMLNLQGVKPNGRPLAGIAIKLQHGVAISWDRRIIRHCTSLSKPDGVGGKLVDDGRNRLCNVHGGERTGCAGRTTSGRRCGGDLTRSAASGL